MPRPNPALLQHIANTGRGDRSMAAFLIANRQRKADNKRADDLAQSLIDLRGAQAEKIENPPPVPNKLHPDVKRFVDASGVQPDDPEFFEKFKAFHESLRAAPSPQGSRVVSPGQSLVDAEGNEIFSVPANDPRPSARDQKIQDGIEILGLTPEDSTKLADGQIRVTPDPTGGRVFITDLSDGTTRVSELEGAAPEPPPDIPQEETLYARAEQATGIVQSAQAGGSQVLGALGGPIDEETVAARQSFAVAENSIIRAFSLNPRYPVAEQNRIRENVAIKPAVLDSAPLMRARMGAVDKYLESELTFLESAVTDPDASAAQVKADKRTISDIKRFRRVLGVPEDQSSEAPDGVDAELWELMTDEERALWQN